MRYLIGLFLLIFLLPLYAVQVDGLYSASVPVENQSQSARKAAISVALNKVLQKVSGRQSILNDASLQKALSNVGSYVEQFQYMKNEAGQNGYLLTVRFQKAALDKLMKQFDVPVWGSNRPDILLWLAVEDGNKRYLVNSDSKQMAAVLKQTATETGLAITLPLLDLQDQKAVGFNDVWAGFSDNILQASQRYSSTQVFYGSLLKSNQNGWRLKWALNNATGNHADLDRADDLNGVIQLAFFQVAEVLADSYAPRGEANESLVTLEVSGVENLTTFVEVTSYLSSLDKVKRVNWQQLSGSKLVLELTVSGDVMVLKNIIALNNVLSPDSPPKLDDKAVDDTQNIGAEKKEIFYYQVN